MLITHRVQRVDTLINNAFWLNKRSSFNLQKVRWIGTFFRRNFTIVRDKFREICTIFVTSDLVFFTLSSPVLLEVELHISYFQKQNGERERGSGEEMKEVQRDEYCSLAIRSYSNELERSWERSSTMEYITIYNSVAGSCQIKVRVVFFLWSWKAQNCQLTKVCERFEPRSQVEYDRPGERGPEYDCCWQWLTFSQPVW